MVDYFKPPTFGDPDREDRARVVFYSILLITLGCVVAATFGPRQLPDSLDVRLMPLAFSATPLAFVCLALNRRGFVRAAAWLFLVAFVALNWGRATMTGGIYAPNLSMLSVMTLFACVTLGLRAGVVAALGCVGVTASFFLFTPTANDATARVPLLSAWIPPFLAVTCTLFLARISLSRTATALSAARHELAVRQAAERKLSLALKTGAIGSFEAELDGDWMAADEQMLNILGVDAAGEPLSRRAMVALIHPDEVSRLTEATNSLRQGARSFRIELRLLAGGEERHIELASTVFREADGALSQIGTVTDLTQRRAAEAERRSLEARLRSAEQMRAIGTMARGIAHDFNNILGAIEGFSSLLEEDLPPGSTEHHFAVRITDATERGKAVVDQILSFSEFEPAPRSIIDLNQLVEGLTPLLESIAGSGVTLDVKLMRSPLLSEVNSPQFTQAVVNLCKNASDALGDQPGRVTLTVRPLTAALRLELSRDVLRGKAHTTGSPYPQIDYAIIAVTDDGLGVPPENLNRLFEPFYTTKLPGPGAGLGLSVVQSAMESHGGVCIVQSEPGRGSCFSILLPLASSIGALAQTEQLSEAEAGDRSQPRQP